MMGTKLSFRVEVDDTTASTYQSRADERGIPLEEEFSQRVGKCRDHTAIKPLYVGDELRQRLEKVLGRNLTDAAVMVRCVENLARVRVGGVIVDLSASLLSRLESRAITTDIKRLLKEQIVADLERFAGLR